EAEELWKAVGVPADRILRFGKKDNFWQMGDTGPCGPCSEMHYYRPKDLAGNRPELVNGDGDDIMEIWNLVFMQYEQDGKGGLSPLPKPSIDTGMGLERTASILQGKETNYEIDLFEPIFEGIWKVARVSLGERTIHTNRTASQVVADHIRAAVFMVFDGVVPSNEGRGYVLRKIVRRALRFGKKLGIEGTFFAALAPTVFQAMGDAYPELGLEMGRIQKVLSREESQFSLTLTMGLKQLEGCDIASGALPGSEIFKLYDTFGFPVDLVEDWCKERGVKADLEGFQKELAEQKAKSRAAMKTHDVRLQGDFAALTDLPATLFVGYENAEADAKVLALFDAEKRKVQTLSGNGFVVLDCTPFYAESGGQIGDTGEFRWEFEGGHRGSARVADCKALAPKRNVHFVQDLTSEISVGMALKAEIDFDRRGRIRAHHTATHLLHAALREVLGTHVKQAGSAVDADRLRFDFSHFAPIEPDQMLEIERLANEQVLKATPTDLREMPIDEALTSGAMALFGEKYGETVRVMSVPGFSVELCGGTHVANTGQIGAIKIISEGAVASGIRRLEAVAGMAALERLQEDEAMIGSLSRQANTARESLSAVLTAKDHRIQLLERELKETKLKAAAGGGSNETVEQINGITVVTVSIEGLDTSALRELMDQVRTRHRCAVIALASTVAEDKISLLVSVAPELADKADAGALLKAMAPHIDGRGGGKKDLAQGGGTRPSGIIDALDTLKASI
ncbi:MAG: alanine--tRNA ligase, partial [Holophaga sp.]|nr:alanine--tRNA ligase [Holophaga sp.]